MAISPHLVEGLKKRFGTHSYLLPNGIDLQTFYPKENPLDYSGVLNILSVGNSRIEYKRVPDVWEAVRILKDKGVKVLFTRVSPADIDDAERNQGLVDRFFVRISEREIAQLYRESHVLTAVSSEIEGFGLPPVEAMATGTPVILTRVPPFLAFDPNHDFAHFVNVRQPDEIAQGIINIAQDGALRQNLIRRGLEVSQNYSLERIGMLLENIIKKHVLSQR
jgi:glycosyltransferase involved in cell wall biosynthesis